MQPLRIGKLARMTGVNVQTLRFYERRGLIPRPPRRPSGYREYPRETIGIIKLIKHVQGLGFSLQEINEVMALRRKPHVTLSAVCGKLESKIEEIDAKIAELTATRQTLSEMLGIHRQEQEVSFAHVIGKHVDRLTEEASIQSAQS